MKRTQVLVLSACLGVTFASSIWLMRSRSPIASREEAARYGFSEPRDVDTLRRIDQVSATGHLSEDDFAFIKRAFDEGSPRKVSHAWPPVASLKDPGQQARAFDLMRRASRLPHFDVAINSILENYYQSNRNLVVRAKQDPDPLIARVAKSIVLRRKG